MPRRSKVEFCTPSIRDRPGVDSSDEEDGEFMKLLFSEEIMKIITSKVGKDEIIQPF